ncbi:MAG: glycerate kinase [Trueperaceae bacterium]|nr:glycerate kinase [Trueperaceae bacterium]
MSRELLEAALRAGLRAVDPLEQTPQHLPDPLPGRLVVVGAGKAAAAMARATEHYYRDRFGRDAEGLVVTRYGHGLPTEQTTGQSTGRIEVVEAAHPVPDEAGVRAAERIIDLVRGLEADDLLVGLFSGGGSALLSAPAGVTLAEQAALTGQLLRSGADIHDINTVRKHLSRVKGGRLAALASPARVVSLLISDVTGDHLPSIASGPTVADPTRFADALAVLGRYGIEGGGARAHLQRGVDGEVGDTPKPGDPLFDRVDNILIATPQHALAATADFFERQSIRPLILSDSLTGEAREAAKFHAALVRQVIRYGQPLAVPCALISGGETTVTVRGDGRGGRNTEFALSLAIELNGTPGVYALAVDTDGIDGSDDAAGAVIGPDVLTRFGVAQARDYLGRNDSYSFFDQTGDLLRTGPTRTNVNDLRVVLVTPAAIA